MHEAGPSELQQRGSVIDGVDGPLRHQCARMRLLQISDKGAVRERDYLHWSRYVEVYFPAAGGGGGGTAGAAQEAWAEAGVGVFCQAAADEDRDGGLRRGA